MSSSPAPIKSKDSGAPIFNSIPIDSARVLRTSMVCEKQSSLTKKVLPLGLAAVAKAIASAAAVPSSSSDALATGIAVSSQINVW